MPAALLRLVFVLATLAAVSGCASSVEARPPLADRAQPTASKATAGAESNAPAPSDSSETWASVAAAPGRLGAELVIRSLALLGVQYRLGGNSPETGLDCSGLVRHVFREAMGLVLPRRSEEISQAGKAVKADELRPGDLVFFNTLRRAFSHVGIYIGNNQFVHAPSTGGHVRVESIDKRYWQSRFNGGRRLASDDGGDAVSALPAGAAQA
ncbi:MAG: C40 family peptidase, partial [Burkholderiaceae bacterium]